MKSIYLIHARNSLVAQTVKSLPAMQDNQVRPLGQEDPLEKEMATYSNTSPRKFHGWRSLAGYSPWGHRVEHDWATSLHFRWGLSDFVFFSTLKKIFFPSVLKRACFTFKIRRKVTARRRNVILMHHLFKLLTSGFMFSFIFKNNLLMIPPSFRAGIYWWY